MDRKERFLKALEGNEDEQGTLPKGYLYCRRCVSSIYKGVIAFYAISPKEAGGECMDCESRYVLYPDDSLAYLDKAGNIEHFVSGKYSDGTLWKHVTNKGG